MSVIKSRYFLVHHETGQRYPIRETVVIGRTSGDIVFSGDTKLSNQHCEVSPTSKGLAVRDLDSANGTMINGRPLAPNQGFLLRPKAELRVGDQAFSLHTISASKTMRKRRLKRPRKSEGYGMVYLVLVAAVLIFAWNNRGYERTSPIQLSQKQLAEVFETYQDLQMSLDRKTAPPQDIARRIQSQVLSRLSAMSRRWADFQPQDNEESHLYNAQLQFASAIAGHAKTELQYINSGDAKYFDELDQWTDQVEQSSTTLRKLFTTRQGPTFPSLIQSPLQTVEREMRQALRDYKRLGNSVTAHEVTESEMGHSIREDLMPKLNAVYTKMGAIVPQNDFERRKVVLEQKLMTAFLGQVKSMALFTSTKDKRYAKELEHWSAQIDIVNTQLKKELNPSRVPAGRYAPAESKN